jgi:hypothetical protein
MEARRVARGVETGLGCRARRSPRTRRATPTTRSSAISGRNLRRHEHAGSHRGGVAPIYEEIWSSDVTIEIDLPPQTASWVVVRTGAAREASSYQGRLPHAMVGCASTLVVGESSQRELGDNASYTPGMPNKPMDYVWVVARFDRPTGAFATGSIVSYHGTREEADSAAARLGAGHEIWPRPAGTAWQPR